MDEIEADKIQSPTAQLRNTASDENSKGGAVGNSG